MKKLAQILYKFRFLCLGLIVVLTIIFGSLINMEMDNSIKAWFSDNDPAYVDYKNFRDTFEGGRFLIVVLRSKDIFSLDVLNYIKEKTEELTNLQQVKRVHSLANANKVIGTPEGIEISPLLSEVDISKLKRIRKYAIEDELFRNYLVSNDSKFSTIVITFEEMSTNESAKAVRQVGEVVYKETPQDLDVFLTGDMMIRTEFDRFSSQNLKIFPILTILIVCIATFILFRSVFKILIILLVAGVSLVWTLGFYSMLGYTFNVVSGMLLPLILILSIADSIHIIEYSNEMIKNHDYNKKEAFVNTVSYISIPCFITSITTAFGLLSLSTSSVDAVKNFGIGSAAGVMFAFFISIVIVPFFSVLIPSHQRIKKGLGWTYLLNNIFKVNQKRFKYILALTMLGFIFFGLGINRIKIETNEIEWFPKNEDIYKSSMLVDKNLSGIGDMEILLQGPKGVLKESDILKRMDSISLKIEKLPHVKKVISLTNYVKRINKALREDLPEEYKIPENKSLIAQELFLFTLSDDGREELERVTTSDYSQGRISIKTEAMASEDRMIMGNLIKEMAKEIFAGTNVKATITGTSYLFSVLDDYLLKSQIKSFSLAFILVIGILFIIFRSARYGMLSIIPNLVPIIFIVGIMGWCGIALNVGTVMIASVALGIAVDDTIHFISRFKKEFKSNNLSVQDNLRKTIVLAGKAIIFTSIINISGFMVLFMSDFQPTREFGMLIALTLFFALIGDMFILPATMMAVRNFFNRGN